MRSNTHAIVTQRVFHQTYLNHVLICLVLATCGCEQKQQVHATNNVKNVLPGIGLPDCYVGMPIKGLKGDWKIPNDPELRADARKTYLDDRKTGLGLKHDGTRILGVFVYYRSDDHEQFSGEIDGGIGPRNSIEDVIRAKGQPTNIAVTKGEKGESIDLWYVEKGITYFFLNKKLTSVTISRPLSDVPQPLKEDIGDSSAYRAIRSEQRSLDADAR